MCGGGGGGGVDGSGGSSAVGDSGEGIERIVYRSGGGGGSIAYRNGGGGLYMSGSYYGVEWGFCDGGGGRSGTGGGVCHVRLVLWCANERGYFFVSF